MDNNLEYLKSELAEIPFASKGQLGEASRAIAPILLALENVDVSALPLRIGKGFRHQLETEIHQLRRAGLRRVVRITAPTLCSRQNKNSLGFARWVDASREWRECEIRAAVLEQYLDIRTGACVFELYDPSATLTLRQSRHIKASDQKKAKSTKADLYVREHYTCPSCGAELEHIADQTNCPYCGGYITFQFFDWQLDSFYLDLRKDSFREAVKEAAVKSAVGLAWVTGKTIDLLADSYESANAKSGSVGMNSYLSAILTVLFVIGFLLMAALLAMPWYARLALGVLAAALIVWGVCRYLKSTDQQRKKKKIVRYSDAYLRSCVYDEIWKTMTVDNLIDFSVDDIVLKSVTNTEDTTTVAVQATVIRKYISPERTITIETEDIPMALTRARYPERKKSKGRMLEEKACPSCGANFEPDENHCCAYCGYGLKIENYVWRRVG